MLFPRTFATAYIAAATQIRHRGLTFMASHSGGYVSRTMDPNAGAADALDPRKMLSPSCERNKQPILDELQALLVPSPDGPLKLLEVASGTGQHVGYFAAALPHVQFSPSDLTTDAFPSVKAWSKDLPNINDPFAHDCSSVSAWDALAPSSFHAIFVANMCHISPFSVTEGLFRGAGRVLASKDKGAKLIIYGPFKTGGSHTTDSNAAFDEQLRARDNSWGYRDIEGDLGVLASAEGLVLSRRIEMPANNFLLVYERAQ